MSGFEELLKKLKFGHQVILQTFNRVRVNIRTTDILKPTIQQLQEIVLIHLAKQNDEMFEKLNACFQEDRQQIKMLEFLSVDLKDIKVKALTFFDRYGPDARQAVWRLPPQELSGFEKDMMARIKSEEEYLFPLLEQAVER